MSQAHVALSNVFIYLCLKNGFQYGSVEIPLFCFCGKKISLIFYVL